VTVQLWIGQEFDTSHERAALHRFWNDMQSRFGQSQDLYLVLANYFIDGRQVDLTVLKRDAIIIIELKECPEPFQATENSGWLTIPAGRAVGTGGQNPFQQAKDYRFRWIDFLQNNQGKFLPPAKAQSMDFGHVSAFVAVSPSLHPDSQNQLPRLPWFRLVGLDQLSQAVYQQTSRKLNFSDQELNALVALLNLRPADGLGSAEQADRWVSYCQILLAGHKDWTGMPPGLYISPDVMDIAPARVVPYRRWPGDVMPIAREIMDQTAPPAASDLASLVSFSKSKQSEGLDLLQVVDDVRRPVVVLGEPGMGKSVALERLALKYAERYLRDPSGYAPVLIRLRQYSSQRRDLGYLFRVAARGGGPSFDARDADEILRNDKLLLLFDGLDEALRDPDVIPDVETFIRAYPQHKYVISCRAKPYAEIGDRIGGCDEICLLRLKLGEAATLWNKAVDKPKFDQLSDKIGDLLRTPLLLQLSPHAIKAHQTEFKTVSQLVDTIVRELVRTLGTPTGDIVERCLFRVALEMQGTEAYTITRDQIFDIVAEYLDHESIAYQQTVAAAVLKHPMLIVPDWNNLSFWHPVLQEYFAARGLQDAVLRQGSVDLVLRYLGDYRWNGTILLLVGLLDEGDATKLIEYLLDFGNLLLAVMSLGLAKSLRNSVMETVVGEAVQEVMAFFDGMKDPADDLAVTGYFYMERLRTPEIQWGYNLDTLIYFLSDTVVQFELQAYVEPYLQSALQGRDEVRCIGGLYLLTRLVQLGATFSDDLIETVVNVAFDHSIYAFAGTPIMASRLIPKMVNREKDLPLWENVLHTHTEETDKALHLLAVLALNETAGDEAVPLLRYALGHVDPQVRLVAVWGMHKHRQKGDLLRMVYDPNPVVAHEATFLLESNPLGKEYDATPGLFKLMVENLIAPLAGKLPVSMLSEQFSWLNADLSDFSLEAIVKPFEHKERLQDLDYAIMVDGLSICYQDSSVEIVALIWGVALADPAPEEDGYIADLQDAKDCLEQVKMTPDGQLYVKGSPLGAVYTDLVIREGRLSSELSGELLTEEHIAYIKAWTDYEPTRDIAAKVLSGRWKAHDNDGE
jgi:hypothetical protein